MNNKIEIIKAMVNKPIKVEIKADVKDDLYLVSKCCIYSVDTDSCVVTREYVSEYIKPADRDDNFETNNYTDIMELELQLNDIDYEDIYDNINDYEYPYNHINHSDLV